MDEFLFSPERVNAAKEGEETGWAFLYNECYPFLSKNALRVLGNTPAAKDAVQDTFLSAYLHIDRLKSTEAFAGWLKKFSFTTVIVSFIQTSRTLILMHCHLKMIYGGITK